MITLPRKKIVKSIIPTIITIFCMLSLISCKSYFGSPSASIGVNVYDKNSKLPINGAVVNFLITNERTDTKITSDSGFAFTGWTGGPSEIKVLIQMDGYQSTEIIVKETDFTGDPKISSNSKINVFLIPNK